MFKFTLLILFCLLSFPSWSQCDGATKTLSTPDPVNTETFEIVAKVYRPPAILNEKFPVVFILPPIVGETPLDAALALNLCLNGIGAYVLDVENDPPEEEQITNLNTHEDALIRAEFALNKLIAELNSDDEVSGEYGLMGASLGGILTGYLAGALPMIKASVIMAGGGNIAEILATSEQESVKDLRQKRISEFNLSNNEEYKELLTPYITRDPLFLASNITPDSVLMFIPKSDIDVPVKNQRDLASAIATPRVIELNSGHLPGIIEAGTVFADEIIKFYKDKLE
jgi:hypothetical protein